MPSTRRSWKTRTADASRAGSSSVFVRITWKPLARATSVNPRMARAKNAFSMSATTAPSVSDRPVFIDRATPFAR